jgi:hypothetical protein
LGAEIEDGFDNNNDILDDCPTALAASVVRSYGPAWFLPSAKELNQMYINKTTLEAHAGFTAFSSSYWSSTKGNGSTAWYKDFETGYQGGSFKFNSNYWRAVRFF